jgi:hypothetical protein
MLVRLPPKRRRGQGCRLTRRAGRCDDAQFVVRVIVRGGRRRHKPITGNDYVAVADVVAVSISAPAFATDTFGRLGVLLFLLVPLRLLVIRFLLLLLLLLLRERLGHFAGPDRNGGMEIPCGH